MDFFLDLGSENFTVKTLHFFQLFMKVLLWTLAHAEHHHHHRLEFPQLLLKGAGLFQRAGQTKEQAAGMAENSHSLNHFWHVFTLFLSVTPLCSLWEPFKPEHS